MLLEFRVENFRSIRDEQGLSLEAEHCQTDSIGIERNIEGYDKPLLPVAAVYGANASGKSNLIKGFQFIKKAVLNSFHNWQFGSGIDRPAFSWGGKRNDDSLFEVAILLKGVRYDFGFVIDDHYVKEEWFIAYPRGKRQELLIRELDKFQFHEALQGLNEDVAKQTRANSLFVSTASFLNHPGVKELSDWFVRCDFLGSDRRRYRTETLLDPDAAWHARFPELSKNEESLSAIQGLLKMADTGIMEVRRVSGQEIQQGNLRPVDKLQFKHDANDEDSWLDLEDESDGTRRLTSLASPLFQALSQGGRLFIDEIDASIHSLISQELIQLFQRPTTNPNNAQLIFTTHDTNLLAPLAVDLPLRRDQIWFTEKDRSGVTTITSLAEFKSGKVTNIEQGYLQGRFGAVPFVDVDSDYVGTNP